jgi:hypothetical protein
VRRRDAHRRRHHSLRHGVRPDALIGQSRLHFDASVGQQSHAHLRPAVADVARAQPDSEPLTHRPRPLAQLRAQTLQYWRALWHVQRINALMRIVSQQLSSLETLPPQHFAAFRGYLGTSSGSQSIQFRAVEAAPPAMLLV